MEAMHDPAVPQAQSLTRSSVVALDELLGIPLRVLDQGFVRVIDYLGSDSAIVQAARVSYGAGTKRVREDRDLIRFLMRHHHTSPFEMCEIKLHIRAPMDCWRQWIRHRTANVNEYSTRYSVAIDAAQRTGAHEWRSQSDSNRQGSKGLVDEAAGQALSERETLLHTLSREIYEERLTSGVAREQARKDLPLSTYTEAYWKIDLHNLLHFLRLRMDPHAQLEIRSYADLIGRQVVRRWCPIAWEAFEDYALGSLTLSRIETEVLAMLGEGNTAGAKALAQQTGWLTNEGELRASRERAEFEAKAARLGIRLPWIEP